MNTQSTVAAEAPIARTLGDFVSNLSGEAIPASVRERARYLILDAVGIALASTQYDFAHRTLSAASEFGSGPSDVIGLGRSCRCAMRLW